MRPSLDGRRNNFGTLHGQNWIEIVNEWIPTKYSEENQNGIIDMQFLTLFKEILWMQFLFETGNYSLVHRNLRYVLEMMAQAHFVERKDSDLDLDEQFEKAIEIEDKTSDGILSRILYAIF